MASRLKYVIVLICCLVFWAGCATPPDRPDDTVPPEFLSDEIDEPGGNHYFDYIIAQMEMRQDNLDGAIARINRVLKAKPEDIYLKKELILLYMQNENQTDALKQAEEVLAVHPDDAEVLIIAATIRQKTGYPEMAAALLERVISFEPDRERVYFVLGDLYLKKKAVDKAAAVYEKMTRQFPGQWDASFLLGRVNEQQGRFEAAEENYKKSLSLEPGLLSPRFALADLYKRRADGYTEITVTENDTVYSMCRDFYGACGSAVIREVAEANPEIEDISRVDVGETIRFPHRDEETGVLYRDIIIDLYQSMLEDHPDEHRAALELALYYHEIGEEEKAGELLMSLGQESRSDERILQYINQLYIKSERYDQAHLIINGMRRGASDHSTLHYISGMLFNRKDEHNRALAHFIRVKEDSEYFNQARLQAAFMYEETGGLQKATDLFSELVAEDPDNVAILFYAGVFFERRKNYEKAEELYHQGIAIDPMNADLYYRLGVVNDEMDNKDEVIRYMKEALKIRPDDAHALNYLGYTYAEMGINLSNARELIERAMVLEPGNGYITDSLGWVYYQKGNIEKALKYLKEAVRLQPDDPILLEHLGDAHARNGDPEKAIKYYHLSLEHSREKVDPDLEAQKKIREKIDALRRGQQTP